MCGSRIILKFFLPFLFVGSQFNRHSKKLLLHTIFLLLLLFLFFTNLGLRVQIIYELNKIQII